MKKVSYRIGIDLGGTGIKVAAYAGDSGFCLDRRTAPTSDGEMRAGHPVWLANVRGLLADLEAAHGPAAHVGVSAPGLANADGSAIRFMPGRLAGLENLNWTEALGRSEKVPVVNDAHAAVLGEIWQGAAQGAEDVIMLTLGTGVGGAIVSGGRLLTGHIGRAGHIGHMTVDCEGAPDICGTPGSLEDAIGNATIGMRSGGRFQTTHELVAAYALGDLLAREFWLRSVRALGAAVASLINVIDPEIVIVGGGIARAGDLLLTPLRDVMSRHEWRPAGHSVDLRIAGLGEWAGTCGAASLGR